MVLVHDLVEVYAGDTKLMENLAVYSDDKVVFDAEKEKIQEEKERNAADKLFNILSEDLRAEFRGLWEEFEERKTLEAKVAKALDKLHVLFQNNCSNGMDFKNYKCTYLGEKQLISSYIEEFPFLQEICKKLLDEAKEKGWLN